MRNYCVRIATDKRACSHGAMHFPTHLILELWRYADFPLLIAESRRQITSVWPTTRQPYSGLKREVPPFAASAGQGHSGVQSPTKDFSLDNACSHCSETKSRYCWILSIGCGSNSNRLSRPLRTLCTIPALSNTRRCLVIACRVSLEPCVS